MIGPWYVNTDARRRAAWGAPCNPLLKPVIINGRQLQCDVSVVPAFNEFERIRAAHRYQPTGEDTGFYNCRRMRHDSKLPFSEHAWARAIDLNWLQNPAGNKLITDMPPEMIADILRVKTNSGAFVFQWGGDWDRNPRTGHTYYDAMHFGAIAHPLDLNTGIAGVTARLPDQEDDMALKPGDRGNAVKAIQRALNAWATRQGVPNWTSVLDDGIYGPGLTAAVKLYQQSANLPVTGDVDGVTAALLLTVPVRV